MMKVDRARLLQLGDPFVIEVERIVMRVRVFQKLVILCINQ